VQLLENLPLTVAYRIHSENKAKSRPTPRKLKTKVGKLAGRWVPDLPAYLARDTCYPAPLSIPLRGNPEYKKSGLNNIAAGRRREKTPALPKQRADVNMGRLGAR